MKNQDIRWVRRFDNFKRAFARIAGAAAPAGRRKLSELEEQGLIQAFEYTHEPAWNTLKDFLESRGATVKIYGSRDAAREAFAAGLITDGEPWMRMIEHRNESSHTCNQQTADAIASAVLTRYVAEFEAFQSRFLELERAEAK
jgi:nucleotidyltransferase substrate binding protein (TIGR01987 family)